MALLHKNVQHISLVNFNVIQVVMVRPPFPSLPPLCPPLATSDCLCLHSASSTSTPLLLPLLCSNSDAYLRSSYNYITPTLRLTVDQHWTCLDLVPMPRAAIHIPLPHLSYLSDPFSLTIVGNYPFLV